MIRHYRGIDAILDQAAPAFAACTVAVVLGYMPRKLPKSTSDDSHLAGDSEQSENKDFAGMAAEVTEGTSDDTHLAADSKRQENAAGFVLMLQDETYPAAKRSGRRSRTSRKRYEKRRKKQLEEQDQQAFSQDDESTTKTGAQPTRYLLQL